MLTRREFMLALGVAPALAARGKPGRWVNDIHSQLNATHVSSIARPRSIDELQSLLRRPGPVCITGGRHAMGGQQFATNAAMIDLTAMRNVRVLDERNGIVEIDSGIEWPELVRALGSSPWSIRQKQTGADRLTLGGSLSANAHGRGLQFQPMAGDVESFVLLDAGGDATECSRDRNRELFSLALGGYGLFGVIASIRLRLARRQKVQRVVDVQGVDKVMDAFNQRIRDGFLYGDFQFSIDPDSDRFLRHGVFSCYRPVPDDTPMPETQSELRDDDWRKLLLLAHVDKGEAYERYVGHYLATSGQLYWSDQHQLSIYPNDYHRAIDARLHGGPSSEMITELYVPRHRLADFMAAARQDFLDQAVNVVYGTVRLIERDDDTFLPWAKQSFACVIFNLHTEHGKAALHRTASTFRRLIDLALARDGSYYLTYHRWARRDQVEAAYPQFAAFLRQKRRHDPGERFTSNWYRHYRAMFAA